MNTAVIVETLNELKFRPNKKLGQNFLCNRGIIEKIINASDVNSRDIILEIGPGLGILTEALVKRAQKVTAVEIDSGLAGYLQKKYKSIENLEIIHADFLKLAAEQKYTKTVSNLPYYCASEILFQIAEKFLIPEIYIMLQKEMALRISAAPGSKAYGAISAVLGLFYEARILFNIDKRSFYPSPDVDSCFLQLTRKKNIRMEMEEIKLFHMLVKSAFWGRRKTILKALNESPHLNYDKTLIQGVLKEAEIDEKTRGEMLSTADFWRLAEKITAAARPI